MCQKTVKANLGNTFSQVGCVRAYSGQKQPFNTEKIQNYLVYTEKIKQ